MPNDAVAEAGAGANSTGLQPGRPVCRQNGSKPVERHRLNIDLLHDCMVACRDQGRYGNARKSVSCCAQGGALKPSGGAPKVSMDHST